jgi:uncharacterized repeat protein (TIGR01451 family)
MTRATRRRLPRLRHAAAAALAAGAFAAIAAAAPPVANTGSGAAVGGGVAEWGQADFFSDMLRAGGNGGQTTVESKLYLRYNCATNIMYAYVAAEPGVTIRTDSPSDNFIKFGVKKVLDGSTGNDGTAPDFEYVGQNGATASGWEASFPLAEGSYTDLNVHTQVNDGGSQTSAVPGRAIPLTVQCGEVPPLEPLQVSKTATTSYQRAFDWSIVKSVVGDAKKTTSDNTTTFSYKVDVTKGPAQDSGFTVSGEISVTNPNVEDDIAGVNVTDEINGGPACTLLADGTDITIPAGATVKIPYTCSVATSAAGENIATAAWPSGSASGNAPFSFGAPSSAIHDTVDVTDTFNNGVPALLLGGAGINQSTMFTYERTVDVPATGCTIYPNVATITSPQELFKQSPAQVEACRTVIIGEPQPPVTPPALKVTKTGPKSAKAGQVITYRIVLRNTGTGAATSVVLRDLIPSGFTLYRLPAGAKIQKGKVVWSVGTMAPGASKTVFIRLRAAKTLSGTRCNTAQGSAANHGTVTSRACTKVIRVAGAARVPAVTG